MTTPVSSTTPEKKTATQQNRVQNSLDQSVLGEAHTPALALGSLSFELFPAHHEATQIQLIGEGDQMLDFQAPNKQKQNAENKKKQ